jgi:hypothetical protein
VHPIIRTARADEDLIAIWTTIAADNPGADIAPGIRHLIVGQYLTLYCMAARALRLSASCTVDGEWTAKSWSSTAARQTAPE